MKKHHYIRRFGGVSVMPLMDWLFAPRIDHRGWSTPSEASRIFLIITLIIVGWWSWGYADGSIVMWVAITLLLSTPILALGWFLLSIIAKNRNSRLLTPKVENALEAKGRLPSHFKNP